MKVNEQNRVEGGPDSHPVHGWRTAGRVFALITLVRGTTQFGKPGVFMMSEENAREVTAQGRSPGFDLGKLVAQKKFRLYHTTPNHEEKNSQQTNGNPR